MNKQEFIEKMDKTINSLITKDEWYEKIRLRRGMGIRECSWFCCDVIDENFSESAIVAFNNLYCPESGTSYHNSFWDPEGTEEATNQRKIALLLFKEYVIDNKLYKGF